MSDSSRISTMLYKMRAFFRIDRGNDVIGLNVTKQDIDNAVAPNNIVVGEGVKKIIVSATPPVSPEVGDLWIDIS